MTETQGPNSKQLDAALTAKANAEAEAATAEAERRRAEATKLAAEADRARAEAVERAAIAARAELDVADRKRTFDNDARGDERNHVFRFDSAVSPNSTSQCIKVLRQWHREDSKVPIEIVFMSPGGDVISGMALFDEITSLSVHGGGSHRITTTIRGYAASMAGILLQSGDDRVGGAESYLMIHEISAGTGGKIGEIKDEVKFYDRICARVVDIFVSRAGGKITKPTFIKRWTRQDWWLDSTEALKCGFIDKIG